MKRKIIIITIVVIIVIMLASCEKEVSKSNPITPKPTGGTLKISSTPSGAKIYLDGKTTGLVTPDSITWLEVKNYNVTLKKELYLDSTFQVNVEESKTKEYLIDFNSSPNMWGSITCQTTPDDAKIFINGKDTGKRTSTTIDSLIPGRYTVKYISENTRDDSAIVTVTSGKNTLSLLVLTDTTHWVDYNTQTSGIFNYSYTKIAIDNNDIIWLGSTENGLTRFDGNIWSVLTMENSGLVGNSINQLKIGPNGNLWICTTSGLNKFDGTNWISYQTSGSESIPSNKVNDITFDSDSNPIIATDNGLAKYKDNKWTVFQFELDFPDRFTENDKKDQNVFTSIDVDNNGNWWATRLRNGIAQWNGTTWYHYFTYADPMEEDSDPSIYYNIVKHSNNEVWFGHRISTINNATVGLSSYSNGRFERISYTRFYFKNVNSINIKNGNEKWIATSAGLYSFINYPNVKEYTKKNTPLATNDIQDIAFDSKGNVWVVTPFNGIYKFKVNNP
jgi:streptogramin lyase